MAMLSFSGWSFAGTRLAAIAGRLQFRNDVRGAADSAIARLYMRSKKHTERSPIASDSQKRPCRRNWITHIPMFRFYCDLVLQEPPQDAGMGVFA